jgi:photosystem II stability/assembly factor-like uncharacterized protein
MTGGTLSTVDTFQTTENLASAGFKAWIDITEGQLINAGDWTATYEGYVSGGQITAYGGSGNVVVSYDSGNNQTIVTGVIPEPATLGLVSMAGAAVLFCRRFMLI